MSISEILSSALSGLNASQAGMRTVSNNIANVNTPGYARERVSLETGVTSGRVNGVVVGEPSRVADQFLEATVYVRAGDAGRAEINSTYLDRLQSLLGASDAESGLPARIDAISSAATAMTGSAGGAQTSAAFVGTVADAITSIQQLDRDVDSLRSDVEGEVGYTIDRVNTLLQSVYDLNDSVFRLEGMGRSSAGAADQRTSAIEELSGLIGVVVREQKDGRVTIDTNSGVQLIDQRLRQLSYPAGGAGGSQQTYPPIEVRFSDSQGRMGAATGEKIDSPAVGGKLGGLLDLRDRQLPAFGEKLGSLFNGLGQTLNTASNAGTAVPAPARLDGRATALTTTDRMGFTGAATFAVTAADGTLLARTSIDFTGLGASANDTVADAIAAINTGLGGTATATFTNGKLSIAATDAGNGVIVAQDDAEPSQRGGVGFSQYFGLNDVVRSSQSTLTPSGFVEDDAHGFGAAQGAELVLRDTTGRAVARHTLNTTSGSTFGDLVTQLNTGPLDAYGDFSMDDKGRLRFEPTANNAGASLSVLGDTTDRAGTGRSFSTITGLTSEASGLATAEVRRDIAADGGKLPLANLQNVAIGQRPLGTGDRRGAGTFVETLATAIDLGKDGTVPITRFAAIVLGDTGAAASRAEDRMVETTTRRDDAIARRDNFSGVSIDEELAQMVVLQNSYSAAARVMTSANAMYDTLLAMLG